MSPERPLPREVAGVDALRPEDGPLVAVIGVFDGIHLGHLSLLERLRVEARARAARPAVITFDAHPDEIIGGAAPPLLVDPVERIRLLEQHGVEIVVVQHFDAALRLTEYDSFIRRITGRTALAGLLMTPDAAFGHDRKGTPEAVAELGARDGFAVVVVPPFLVDGDKVSSTAIRALVAAGDLSRAERLLGRPFGVVGVSGAAASGLSGEVSATRTVGFPIPVALPPSGRYRVRIAGAEATARVDRDGGVVLLQAPAAAAPGRIEIVFIERLDRG